MACCQQNAYIQRVTHCVSNQWWCHICMAFTYHNCSVPYIHICEEIRTRLEPEYADVRDDARHCIYEGFDIQKQVSRTGIHYNDVIMGAIASQITSLTIVYSIVYSDSDQRKHQSSASLAFVRGIQHRTGDFPAQMASYVENVSVWWRHHEVTTSHRLLWV